MRIRKNKKRIKELMEVVTLVDIYLRNSMTKALEERNFVQNSK
jgi:hypothetical protein